MAFDFKSLLSNPAILTTALAGAGGAFGNKAEKQTSTSTTNLTPEQLALLKQIQDQYMNLSKDTNLSGYEAGQVSDINKARGLQLQNLQENLAFRGITGNAQSAAENNVDSQRFSDIVKLHQQIPLLQNQLQTNAVNTGLGVFGSMPKNTVNTGTTSGNVLGGGLSNAAATLAYFLGQGAFKKPATSNQASTPPYKAPIFNPNFNINRTPVYNPGY